MTERAVVTGPGRLFSEFLYALREAGVPVSTQGWLALIDALEKGVHGDSLDGFYRVSRCVLIQSETQYDVFDQVFGHVFRGVEMDRAAMHAALEDWLSNPQELLHMDPALREALESMDVDLSLIHI